MDVRDNPRFLDAVVTPPGGSATAITRNGFRNFFSGYTNGSGQASIVSGVVGGEVQLTDRLRADLGVRVEYNNFVQSAENTSTFDLDEDPATTFDNETFGNNSFRHFDRDITDWSGSLGLNYRVNDNFSVFTSAGRGYKMPALDEFLNASAQDQVDLFDSREVQSIEGGVKGFTGPLTFTVNGFYTKLKNIVSQGLVVDTVTGGSAWVIIPSPENRSYGAEVEAVVTPVEDSNSSEAARSSRRSWAPAPAPTSAAESPVCRPRSPTLRPYSRRAVWAAFNSRPTGTGSGRASWTSPLAPSSVVQLLQLRRGLHAAGLGDEAQHRPFERVPEHRNRAGQPAAAHRRRQPALPGSANPAAAPDRIGELQLWWRAGGGQP